MARSRYPQPIRLHLAGPAVLLLIGPAASGKSTFAKKLLADGTADQVVSSDAIRAELGLEATEGRRTFREFHRRVAAAANAGKVVIADATSLTRRDRHQVFDQLGPDIPVIAARMPDHDVDELLRRDAARDRQVGEQPITRQVARFESAATRRMLLDEPFSCVVDVDGTDFVRCAACAGPGHDIVGDVHACATTFEQVVGALGYNLDGSHPAGRGLIVAGDWFDRGPPLQTRRTAELLLELLRNHGESVVGNHCDKLRRYLRNAREGGSHGLAKTLEQLRSQPDADTLIAQLLELLSTQMPAQLLLDNGRALVVHAAAYGQAVGAVDRQAEALALYGPVVRGEKTAEGFPVRIDWAQQYTEPRTVIHGHVVHLNAGGRLHNNVVAIDTGCAVGGALSVCSYPELTRRSFRPLEVAWDPAFSDPHQQAETLPADPQTPVV